MIRGHTRLGHFRNDVVIFRKVESRWLIAFGSYGPDGYPVR